MKFDTTSIFTIQNQTDFLDVALRVFRIQAEENEVYKNFLHQLKIDSHAVTTLERIPFLPVEFFKLYPIVTGKVEEIQNATVFTSSGTTNSQQSKHYVSSLSVYEQSYIQSFQQFYGNIEEYCVLALLPSYLEREGSSLIYMTRDLIHKSKHAQSGFYLNNYDELVQQLQDLHEKNQKVLLIGVTYALLDLLENFRASKNSAATIFKNVIVMETGGMKGKRKEMVREELHKALCEGFGVNAVHSEYGMTELLSQAYSQADGKFYCPPWMKIMVRDTNDPFNFIGNYKTGGLNVIDLANINSCSFIATQDLGKTFPDESFEILGRFDNSDIRGCNLMVQ